MQHPSYDAVADMYAPSDDDLSRPVAAALLDLADAAAGENALDLACGDGLITRELARRGLSVTGLDLSNRLIERARKLESPTRLGITYIQADAADPDSIVGVFDLVVCHFGMTDIDDIDRATANIARWLRPDGRFVFSILHPCFGGGDGADPSWPTSSSYQDERRWRATGSLSTLRQQVGANHRMLSTYVNTLASNGLLVDAMREPPAEQSWTVTRPSSARQPVYLVVRCQRRSITRAP